MAAIKSVRLKTHKRRYSQLKKSMLRDIPASREDEVFFASLPDHNDFYRQMFDRNRAVKMIVDPSNAQIVDVNQAACDYYGYTREQFKSLNVRSLSDLSQTEIVEDMQHTVADAGKIFESRHRLASGEVRDVEIFSGSIEYNNKPYLYAIIQDTTDRKRAERALRESEALYRLLARNMPNSAVFMFDCDMRYTLAEGPFLKRFGALYEHIIGKTVHEALPVEAANFLAPILQRALNGQSFSYERVLDDYAYQAFVTPVRNDNGQIIGGMILSRDISEAKRTEAALRESEKLYHSIITTMSEGVVMQRQDGTIESCNPAAERILGLTADQMMGRTSADPRWGTIHEDGSPFMSETHPVMLTLHTGQPLNNVIMGVHKPDDSLAWISINSNPLFHHNETQPYAVVATLIDITDRKRAEDALRASETRFRSLVNLAPVGIIENDAQGNFTFCNAHWSEMTGLLLHDLQSGESRLYPKYLTMLRAAQQRLNEAHRPIKDLVIQYQRPDGTSGWASGGSSPMFDAKGILTGYIGVMIDITDHKRLEAELRISESRFHSLVDLAPVGIIQTDSEGKRVFCNSHWCEMTGITLEQALGDEHYETIYLDDLPTAAGTWDKMMETKLPFDNLIFRYQRPDKSTLWVSGNGRPLYDAQGNVTGYLGAVTDISHLKALEDTLLISESRFRTLIDLAPVGIVETNEQGTPIFTNAQWHTLSGISELENLSENASATIHPDDQEWVRRVNDESVKNADLIDNIEYRFLHPDGKVVWVSDSSRPLMSLDGRISGHIITMTDITERKRLEDALRNNEEQLRLITDNVQDLITQNNLEGRIIFASPSSRTMLGYEPEELLNRFSLDLIHPDDVAELRVVFEKALQEGAPHLTVESRLRHADGHYLWAETIIKFIYDDHSKLIGGVYISRDVSERKRMQAFKLETERLQSALDKEHELSTLKTRMMERIAHEFRTPLTVIQSSTETLTHYLDRLTAEQRNSKSSTIKGQIQRLTDMLQEIGLAVNGSFTPDRVHRQPTDVSALCRTIAADLERQFNLPSKYVLNLPETAKAALDPQVSKNAIMQVLRNAARFSAPDSPVTVNLERDSRGITIQVTDEGIGILPHEQPRIFEPFFRGSNISEINGLGVGLTIARAAVEAQGGTIGLKSVVGQGTTVTIWLPG